MIPSKPSKKKPVKLIATGVISIICVCLILYSIYAGIFSPSSKENETNNEQHIEEAIPEIIVLDTASHVDLETGNYTPEVIFFKGENISIYLKYTNISTINRI